LYLSARKRRESSALLPEKVRPNHMLQRVCYILGRIFLYRKVLLMFYDESVKIFPPQSSRETTWSSRYLWARELHWGWVFFTL